MRALILTLLLLFSPQVGTAQTWGMFDIPTNCAGVPPEVMFAGLPSWYNMAEARECSRQRGMLWVLKLGFNSPLGTPVINEATTARDRINSLGLMPYIVAVQYYEEWYWTYPNMSIEQRKAVWEFGSQQHQTIKDLFPGKAIVYVDGLINDNEAYGPGLYHPLPRHTDVIALETYVPVGGSWDHNVEPKLQYVYNTYSKPIVLIGQSFRHVGDPMWDRWPTLSEVLRYRSWITRPNIIGGWLFTWGNRSNGIMGLIGRPDIWSWYLRGF